MTAAEIDARLSELTTNLMFTLRMEKRLVVEDIDALCALVQTGRDEGLFDGSIDVRLAGSFWYTFCALLGEADHARDPKPILDAAWRYQDQLSHAFNDF